MDATLLRIVLLILGLIFLAGIYLYETARRKRDSAQARRHIPQKREPTIEPIVATRETEDGGVEVDESEALAPMFEVPPESSESMSIDSAPIEALDTPAEERIQGALAVDEDEKITPSKPSTMQQQELFGFSAREEFPADVPDLILQINLRARAEPFEGEAIERAMQETGMRLSDMAIYQRFTSDGTHKVLFNIASMVEPGVFPIQSMAGFSTPGLTLFTQLPGPVESMMIFSDMLYTAERLAATLQGDLQDETHSAMSKQTIEHMRERIMEHKRQVQLARRKG